MIFLKLIFSVVVNELDAEGFPSVSVDVDQAAEAVRVSRVFKYLAFSVLCSHCDTPPASD